MCVEWEAATAAAQEAGVRTVHARTGLVVAREGGAWGRLFPLFRAGLGGRLGNGRQYWSFIALHDEIAALRHILETESLSGPVNLTGPDPVTNGEVTAAMGRVLHRPTLLTAPAPALRIALGDFAGDVLSSQRVLPGRSCWTRASCSPSRESTRRSARRCAEHGARPARPRPAHPARMRTNVRPRAPVPRVRATAPASGALLASLRTRLFRGPVGGKSLPEVAPTRGGYVLSSARHADVVIIGAGIATRQPPTD